MLIKLLPEDFLVRELTRWSPSSEGSFAVYELEKRKLDTFEAMRLVSARANVPLDRIAYVGLKDRQGVTKQLISIAGAPPVQGARIPGVRLRYLGRSPRALCADDLAGNAFKLVVRDLTPAQLERLPERLRAVERHGLIDYFDDQRFGSLVAGQGLPGRDLVRGNFEAVVKALLTEPGARDPLPEKRWKHLVGHLWGSWDELARKWGNRRGASMVRHLRRRPDDWAGALQRLPAKERAIHVFAYQSLIWNQAVAGYLRRKLPAARLTSSPYAGGRHVWPDYGPDEAQPALVESFPLLDHTVQPADPDVRAAIDEALAAEGLTLERFRIEGIPGCFFKHHERLLIVRPARMRLLGAAQPDDRRPGSLKQALEFELPPGAYATLVLKRLFQADPRRGDVVVQEQRRRRRKKERARERQPRERSAGGAPKTAGKRRKPKKPRRPRADP